MNGEDLAQGLGPPADPSPSVAAPPVPAAWPVIGRTAAAPTGDQRVDALVTRLEELAGRPVAEHVGVYADLHHGLQETLAATGQDPVGHDSAGHDSAGQDPARQVSQGDDATGRPSAVPRPGPPAWPGTR